MTKTSKMLALLFVVGFFVVAGTVSANTGSFVQPAAAITFNENLTVNGVGYFESLHVGSQGVGGVTYFNGTILNGTTDVNAKDVPVTIGDSLRIDGELWAGWSKGTTDNWSLKISDDMYPTFDVTNTLGRKSNRWKNIYGQMGDFSDTLTVNGISGITDADIPDDITITGYLPVAGGTITGDLLVQGTLDVQQDLDMNGNDIHSVDNFTMDGTGIMDFGAGTTFANDGAGSTLDADMLDGQEGAWYMPVSTDNWVDEAGDTMSGDLTMGANDILGLNDLQGATATFSGAVGVDSLAVTNAATVGTTLGVTGLTTLSSGALFGAGLDMGTNLITNIGNSNTDFTASGGLNLFGILSVSNDIVFSGGKLDMNGFQIADIGTNAVDFDASGTLDMKGLEYIIGLGTANPLEFEGATNGDGFQTTLAVTDPTQANTITLPDSSGIVALTNDLHWETGNYGTFEQHDDVIVGPDTANDKPLTNQDFILDGNDLYVLGDIGTSDDVYAETSFIAGATSTYADGSLTDDGDYTVDLVNGSDTTLTVTNAGAGTADLDVQDDIRVGDDLDVIGQGTFGSIQGGAATFTGLVQAQSGLDVTTEDLTVGGALFSVDDDTGNTVVGGTLDVTGLATLSGGALLGNTLDMNNNLLNNVSQLTWNGSGTGQINGTTIHNGALDMNSNNISNVTNLTLAGGGLLDFGVSTTFSNDGPGSTLNADMVDGKHLASGRIAGTGTPDPAYGSVNEVFCGVPTGFANISSVTATLEDMGVPTPLTVKVMTTAPTPSGVCPPPASGTFNAVIMETIPTGPGAFAPGTVWLNWIATL